MLLHAEKILVELIECILNEVEFHMFVHQFDEKKLKIKDLPSQNYSMSAGLFELCIISPLIGGPIPGKKVGANGK